MFTKLKDKAASAVSSAKHSAQSAVSSAKQSAGNAAQSAKQKVGKLRPSTIRQKRGQDRERLLQYAPKRDPEAEKLATLCDMGFSQATAREALRRCNGNVASATDWLLNEANAPAIFATETHAVSAESQPLSEGCLARISGLRGNLQLNGQVVLLERWDAAAQRWIATLPSGEHKSIKPTNLDSMDGLAAEAAWNQFSVEADLMGAPDPMEGAIGAAARKPCSSAKEELRQMLLKRICEEQGGDVKETTELLGALGLEGLQELAVSLDGSPSPAFKSDDEIKQEAFSEQSDEIEANRLRWTCSACGEVNKGSRKECHNCGRGRPENWRESAVSAVQSTEESSIQETSKEDEGAQELGASQKLPEILETAEAKTEAKDIPENKEETIVEPSEEAKTIPESTVQGDQTAPETEQVSQANLGEQVEEDLTTSCDEIAEVKLEDQSSESKNEDDGKVSEAEKFEVKVEHDQTSEVPTIESRDRAQGIVTEPSCSADCTQMDSPSDSVTVSTQEVPVDDEILDADLESLAPTLEDDDDVEEKPQSLSPIRSPVDNSQCPSESVRNATSSSTSVPAVSRASLDTKEQCPVPVAPPEVLRPPPAEVFRPPARPAPAPPRPAPTPPRIVREDWWSDADTNLPGLEGAPRIAQVTEIRILQTPPGEPWALGKSTDLYRQMGLTDPSKSYFAYWVLMGDITMLTVAEILDKRRFDLAVSGDALKAKLKFILNPRSLKLPIPVKGPRDAETIGVFYGKSTSLCRGRTPDGVDVVSIHADLYSKWLIKKAMQSVGFRKDAVIDLLLIDWPGRSVLTGVRLNVTDSFLKVYNAGNSKSSGSSFKGFW